MRRSGATGSAASTVARGDVPLGTRGDGVGVGPGLGRGVTTGARVFAFVEVGDAVGRVSDVFDVAISGETVGSADVTPNDGDATA